MKPKLCPKHQDAYCWETKSLTAACPLVARCVEEYNMACKGKGKKPPKK